MRNLITGNVENPEQEKVTKKSWTSVFKSKQKANLVTGHVEGTDSKKRCTKQGEGALTDKSVTEAVKEDHTIVADKSDRDESWDSSSIMNSFSSLQSAATVSTLKYFGLSNHPGKSVDDVTIDAFMDIQSGNDKKRLRRIIHDKPYPLQDDHIYLHKAALVCIEKRDFKRLLAIIKATPELLLYECRTRDVKDGSAEEKLQLRDCYGGNLLHVLVSQKPGLSRKKVKNPQNSNRVRTGTPSLPFINGHSFELHIMSSVPPSILTYIIKKEPKALEMTDDLGRLPIHCATLSLSSHVEEVNKLCKSQRFSNALTQFIIKEVNIIHVLLKYNRHAAAIADDKGNLPIHYAVSIEPDYFSKIPVVFERSSKYGKPSAVDTVKKLLEIYPEAVCIKNKKGDLPIHINASQGSKINLHCLKLLLSNHIPNQDVATERNDNGDPPLSILIKCRAPAEAIKVFTSTSHSNSSLARLFVQHDQNNDNPLHVALKLTPVADVDVISLILSLAPFTASTQDGTGKMPIRYGTCQRLPEKVIRQMLARDMPIQIGAEPYSTQKSTRSSSSVGLFRRKGSGLARHVVGKSHHHSFWHILMECDDKYIDMVQSFLSEEATHAQIVTLARQIGPDGTSVLINCVSDKCKLVFHTLLRFYDRYEILLSSKDTEVKAEDLVDGVQTFHALDHGLTSDIIAKDKDPLDLERTHSTKLSSSLCSISTAVRVRSSRNNDNEVEISLLSKEKSKVLLRCYQHEEAFFAEIKVREEYDFPRQYFEELYNYHRDESYTYLTLSKAEKLCCITFERPDHTLAEVFASVSSGGKRSQRWIEKCWIVLKQIATALKYLHYQNLIHGHLDATNIAKYHNTWKIGKLATVQAAGTTMRGKFRSCAPPESITSESVRSSLEKVSITSIPRSRTETNHHMSAPKVKFASNVVEGTRRETTVKINNESRDDATSNKPPLDDINSVERNACTSILTWSSCGTLSSSSHSVTATKKNSEQTKEKDEKCYLKPLFIAEKCKATPAWDMWGFGLLMVQLLLGRCMHLPNFEKADDAILKKLHCYDDDALRNICNHVNAVVGHDAADLIEMLLKKDPSERPQSMEEVLAHKYFQVLTIYI